MARETKIFDSDIKYNVEYRDVNYPRLEFRKGELELILPINSNEEKKILEKHKRWIRNKQHIIEKAMRSSSNKKLNARSMKDLRKIIADIIKKQKVPPKKIDIRLMSSKWGSCSSKGNITFNSLLKYLPKRLIEYVVIHEVTHLDERKHNSRFWNLVSIKINNYERCEKELLLYWFTINKKKLNVI